MAQTLNFEQQLSDLLDTRDFHPETLGRDGRPCDTEDAKTFSFDYTSGSGKNYGTMVIVLGNDNEMMIMYGDNLGKTIEDPQDRNEFFDFQQQLMQLANRNRWTGTLTNLNKLKRVQAGIAAIQEGLFEGYYGTRKVSYAGEPTEARLMIKHNRVLGENDARFRYVESLFIETADQERFKLPFVNMAGGRAMLEHVRQGGKPYDVRGSHITETVTELKVLSRFRRASQNAMAESVKQSVIEQANNYYQQLRESLKHMGTHRGYAAYFESWSPMQVADHESLVEDIKSLFVEQTLDSRIEEALPLLARIQQQGQDMKEAQIFENWINNLAEGTWALPETPEQQNRLKQLMSQPLEAGPDGTNATEQLYDLVGDDQLFDLIGEQAQQDPDASIWENPAIMDRLSELGVDVPQSDTPPEEQEGEYNDLNEGVLTDSTGSTLDHICNRFGKEVRDFEATGDMSDDLYHALYDYYFDDMPYGTKKARDGDPYEWISDRFAQDRGIAENLISPMSMPVTTEGSSCNMTAEGAYCPEHGLAECGGMYEMGGTVAGAVAPMEEGSERDKYYYQRNNIWRVMDGDELVHEYTPDRYEVVGAKKLLAQFDDEGYDVTHVISPMGTVTYLYGKPEDDMDEGKNDDPMNYNAAITGSYYESDELTRIKSLALLK